MGLSADWARVKDPVNAVEGGSALPLHGLRPERGGWGGEEGRAARDDSPDRRDIRRALNGLGGWPRGTPPSALALSVAAKGREPGSPRVSWSRRASSRWTARDLAFDAERERDPARLAFLSARG